MKTTNTDKKASVRNVKRNGLVANVAAAGQTIHRPNIRERYILTECASRISHHYESNLVSKV